MGQAAGYAFFDHTADIGIRARGMTLAEVFVSMAQGLIELIAEDSRLEPKDVRSVHLTAPDANALLLTWLQEVLFWCSAERFVPCQYALEEVTPTLLRGTVRGERFDPERHVQGREVKAITRHLLDVDRADGGWSAQVIVDI